MPPRSADPSQPAAHGVARPPHRLQATCWIAWHLTDLSLESFLATLDPALREHPWALTGGGAAAAVETVNAAAFALGVRPGQRRATALALAPALRTAQTDERRDAEARQAVAHMALVFTPKVTIWGPHTVLLEVASTLRLWGGWAGLQVRLRQALTPLGHRIQWAAAPTPLGAAWLACAGGRPLVSDEAGLARPGLGEAGLRGSTDLSTLSRALDGLTLRALPGFEALQERAAAMGLHTLADLRSLPRDGLARRFGAGWLELIDRARGEVPDPQLSIRPPEVFASRVELFARADTGEQLLAGAQVLVGRLLAWARARQGRVERLTLTMHHEPRHRAEQATPAATPLVLSLAEPSNDPVHLQMLLREHLAGLFLPAPTLELSLHCAHLAPGPTLHGELFPDRANEQASLRRLLERLHARLGPGQVHQLQRVADHRPERATAQRQATNAPSAPPDLSPTPHLPKGRRTSDVTATGRSTSSQELQATPRARQSLVTRPVWLLEPPQPLPPPRSAYPIASAWLEGHPLRLLAGPHRIESGWWDGAPVVRDYFIAQAADGALVWVYRSRLPEAGGPQEGWFLQGRFA